MSKLFDKVYDADLKKVMDKKNYAYFEKGDYNLNIIAIRKEDNQCSNKFEDIIAIEYKVNDKWKKDIYQCTTLPGLRPLSTPSNSNGCAIIVPGQWRSCWQLGYHKSKIRALVQRKPINVYRDNNKDLFYDYNPSTISSGMFGINIHPAGEDSTQIDNWSEGCIVFKKKTEWNKFLALCEKAAVIYGNSFTVTILKEKEL